MFIIFEFEKIGTIHYHQRKRHLQQNLVFTNGGSHNTLSS
jgi:hypothetical protein